MSKQKVSAWAVVGIPVGNFADQPPVVCYDWFGPPRKRSHSPLTRQEAIEDASRRNDHSRGIIVKYKAVKLSAYV